jgi:hypothetical protein
LGATGYGPIISNSDTIIWVGVANNNCYVYRYNINNSVITRISNDGSSQCPQINDRGDIVWNSGENPTIYLFQNDTIAKISTQKFSTNPIINNEGHIVWKSLDWDANVDNLFEYIWLRKNDGTIAMIAKDYHTIKDPISIKPIAINDLSQVLWIRYTGVNWEVYLNENGNNIQLTNNSNSYPSLNNSGKAVWSGWNGNNYDIFVRDYDGTVTKLTNNGYCNIQPKINEFGQIVWICYDGYSAKIYLSTPRVLNPALYLLLMD